MAKDVAQRDFDLAGFRISNLGDPAAAGDATKTDNVHVPLAASRRNAGPGTSAFASPADHIHPIGPDFVALDDPALQVVGAKTEVWFGVIDFDNFVGDQIQVGLAAMLQTCLVQAWLDGEIGNPTAGSLVMNIDSSSPTLVPIASIGSAPFARPSGAHLLTLTVEPLGATEGRSLGRIVTLRGLS
jgi:hypothetical protein